MEVTLQIVIRPTNDPPKVVDPSRTDLLFPPVPFDLSKLPEEGISVAALTKTNNELLYYLIKKGLGQEALRLMAAEEKLQTLLARFPRGQFSSELTDRFSLPLMIDENRNLGIAIYRISDSSDLGKWQYKIENSWKDLNGNISDGASKLTLFLSSTSRLRFWPKDSETFWRNSDAFEKTSLFFCGWDASDNSTAGERLVELEDIKDTITSVRLSFSVYRLGCDGDPGSMAKNDSCGVCNGRDSCIGCDGKPNSGAKIGEFPPYLTVLTLS